VCDTRITTFYAQDSYKLRPRLTLNYGLRYDLWTCRPPKRSIGFPAVDPKPCQPRVPEISSGLTLISERDPGENGRENVRKILTRKHSAPRVGFAYSINDKTVLRGGLWHLLRAIERGIVLPNQDGLGFFNRQTITPTNGGPTQIDNGRDTYFPPHQDPLRPAPRTAATE